MSAKANYLRFPPRRSVDLFEPFDSIISKLKHITSEFQPLYPRKWTLVAAPKSPHNFRVMQFNILAEGLSAHPSTTPPFSISPDGNEICPSECGGFDTTSDASTTFNFENYRKWRILEEIERCSPDVLALEECDHFHDFFEPALFSMGYSGIFQPKEQSPSTRFGYYSDGVALFWRTGVLNALPTSQPLCASRPCPYITITLCHNATGTPIVFACTHLKAKSSDEFEAIRASQIAAVLEGVRAVAQSVLTVDGDANEALCRCVVMGDFNADACQSVDGTQPVAVPTALRWCDGALSSAYPLPTSYTETDGLYSTWKTRGGKEAKRVIDYILYTRECGLEVTSLLQPPTPEDLANSQCKLPDLRYPSDHVAIAADFDILL